jgi:serine/threonine-protein kinase
LLLSVDQGAAQRVTTGSFVGRVAGSSTFIVIVTNGTNVGAYACDGTSTGQLSTSEWFKGTVSGASLDLMSLSGAARLTAQLGSSAITGFLHLSGGRLAFTANLGNGVSGFYYFRNTIGSQSYQAGWIVLPTGEQRGSLRVNGRAFAHAALNVASGTATLASAGNVKVGKFTASNVVQFQMGCFPC